MVKVRHASWPVLTSQAPTQLRVPSCPPVLSPCRTSSLPPRVLIASGAAVKPCVFDGVPVAGSVGAAALTSQTTSPESLLSAIMRMSLVATKTLLPYSARPRLVRDFVILGSKPHGGTAWGPLRTSTFTPGARGWKPYKNPPPTGGVSSPFPRGVPPVARPPIENRNLSLRSLTFARST